MKIRKTEQIGKVLLKQIRMDHTDGPIYSDGAVEDELYRRFKTNHNCGMLSEGKKFASWAHEYHLSPVRQNLLKWFPFDSNGSVLEVGAGCGALTGLLCDKLKKVTALEYSYRRALVTAQRHSKRSNLDIVVDGLQDYECEQSFNYITVIGVLEYAGEFYGGKNPYESFLIKIRELLKSNGTLILAIENKIGLKYITGAPEDHTGKVFESIYNYPSSDKIRTFCKKELTEMLLSAGFCDLSWYYPLPDYKLPQIIISDKLPPKKHSDCVWSLFPSKTSNQPRKEVLSEEQLGKAIAEAGLFGEFANSFLVVGRTKKLSEGLCCLRFDSARSYRKPKFRTDIMVCQADQEKLVIKSPSAERAKPFIKLIAEREKRNAEYLKKNFEVHCGTLKDDRIEYEYLPHESLQDKIAEYLHKCDFRTANERFQTYVDKLHSLARVRTVPEEFFRSIVGETNGDKLELDCFSRGLLDLTPSNILVDSDRWIVIDNEWSFDFSVPIIFLLFRAIKEISYALQPEIRKNTNEQNPVIGIFASNLLTDYVPVAWAKHITEAEVSLRRLMRWEFGFQKYVTGFNRGSVGRIRLYRKRRMRVPDRRIVRPEQYTSKLKQLLKRVPGMQRITFFLERTTLYGRT